MTTSEERFEAWWTALLQASFNPQGHAPEVPRTYYGASKQACYAIFDAALKEQDRYYAEEMPKLQESLDRARIKELETLVDELNKAAVGSVLYEQTLEAELAALKGKQEPVATVIVRPAGKDEVVTVSCNPAMLSVLRKHHGAPLYLSPPNEKAIRAAALLEAGAWFDGASDKQCYLAAQNLRLMAEELEK